MSGSTPRKHRSTLAEAKVKLDLPELWRRLNFPGEPKGSTLCPFHEDRRASFSAYRSRTGRWRWKCFAGCGEGDEIDLLAKALDLPKPEACRRFLEMADGDHSDLSAVLPIRVRRAKPPLPWRPPVLPLLEKGTHADLRGLAELRNISPEGLNLAITRGLLYFATLRGVRAWIVTDATRFNVQARRLDGNRWEHLPSKPKAWTLPGSRAAWPIGVREASTFAAVAMVEGGPDLIAACHFIAMEDKAADVAPVAMLGATNNLPPESRALFASKRVRIFPHLDLAGSRAALRWTEQLRAAGTRRVDAFSFDGLRRADNSPINDLNDLCFIDPEDFERERALWELLP